MHPNLELDCEKLAGRLKAELIMLSLQVTDLNKYLPLVAQAVQNVLKPAGIGCATYLAQGGQIGYALCSNLDHLRSNHGVFLPEILEGLEQVFTGQIVVWKDIPHLPHRHLWVGARVLGKVSYALHVWFDRTDTRLIHDCEILAKASIESLEFFLTNQGIKQASEIMPQIVAQTHLLEELVGENSLDQFGWKLVNYTREALRCHRVSLLTVDEYTESIDWAKKIPFHERHYTLRASSGLRKVNKRAEQAVILREIGRSMIGIAYKDFLQKIPEGKDPGAPGFVGLAVARRDVYGIERPYTVLHYFERMPMNWVAVAPLIDRRGVIAGILVCEGQEVTDHLQSNLGQMTTIAKSAGPSLGQSLQWEKDWSLVSISKIREFLIKATPSWRKLMAKKWALGLSILAGILLFPLPQTVKGTAVIKPVHTYTFPAHRTGTLIEKPAQVGQSVSKGDLLAAFEVEDLIKELAQAQQKAYQAQAAAGRAGILGDSLGEAKGRIESEGAQVAADQVRLMLERSFIHSPCDGILIGPNDLKVKTGGIVSEGSVVAQVIDPTSWAVHISLREQDLIKLEKRLEADGPCKGSLNLLAHPNHSYELWLTDKEQLQSGTNFFQEAYIYTVVLPLQLDFEEGEVLRPDFIGDASIDVGWQTLAQMFFQDFVAFCKVRSF